MPDHIDDEVTRELEDEAWTHYCAADEDFREWLIHNGGDSPVAFLIRSARLMAMTRTDEACRDVLNHLAAIVKDYTDDYVGRAQMSGRYDRMVQDYDPRDYEPVTEE